MIITIDSLKNGIELLENRKLHFKISIYTLQSQIDKYQKELDKLDYQITKTKEAIYERERTPNTD